MDFVNQTIGKYQLTRFIGEGGMANVYEGTHVTLGTKAAIKILNPILAQNKEIRKRFQNEAAFMATLDHPNITKVIDFEDNESHLAIVMELLEGMDLNEWVKQKGAFTLQEFKPILIQILQAFQYAHHKGILHRDIKPSNIFLDNNGKVKILDFGIAKLFGTGNEMTQTGTQMGTPAYMSPEQVRAEKSIDHRSDIYSLGVTLYFALAGRSPYDTEKESQFDIFNKIVFEALPKLNNNDFANSIITKSCEKDRALRFQSVEEIEVFLNSDFKQVETGVDGDRKPKNISKSSKLDSNSKLGSTKTLTNTNQSFELGKVIFVIAAIITVVVLIVSIPNKESDNVFDEQLVDEQAISSDSYDAEPLTEAPIESYDMTEDTAVSPWETITEDTAAYYDESVEPDLDAEEAAQEAMEAAMEAMKGL
jgi:serine/threonine protein kinase